MDIINEVTLRDLKDLGALVYFRVVEEVPGKFQLHCRKSWQEGETLLITQRKKPRTWSSLDSLYDYIDKTYGPVPICFLRNYPEEFTNAFLQLSGNGIGSSEGGSLVD